MEHCESNDIPGLLVNIDFEKAFDSLEWEYVYSTLKFLNFGNNIISWIKLLYNGSTSKVLNNGWVTKPINLTRGLRQGCPLSPYLFVLAAEILANKIRKNENIKGINIGGREHKLSMYADDTEVIISFDENSLNEVVIIFKNFEKISGLGINYDKTEILRVGSIRNKTDILLKNYGFKWKNSITVLGLEILTDINKTFQINYSKKIASIKNLMNIWSQRDMTMFGKILVSKSLILSQYNYLLACLPTPNETKLKELDDKIINFVRSNRSAQKISKNILQLDKLKGGLNLTLMGPQARGLKITWVQRLTNSLDGGWKDIVRGALPLKNDDFWLCNLNKNDIPAIFGQYKSIPHFWKSVIKSWCEFNFYDPNTYAEIISQPLWFNSWIKDDQNKLIFYESFYDQGILKVSDLLVNKKLATYEELKTKYQHINVTFLKYYGLLSMIPSRWKREILKYETDNNTLRWINTHTNNLLKIKNKEKICASVVKTHRDQLTDFPEIAFNKWKSNLNLTVNRSDFLSVFEHMYTLTTDRKLLFFKYKLLHRNIITNRNLNLWDRSNNSETVRSELCTFCNALPETIEHLFYECEKIKKLFRDLFNWIFQKTGIRIEFSKTEILLGVAPTELQIFNLIILIVQYYIYSCKYAEKLPIIQIAKYKIEQQYEAEKYNANQNRRRLLKFQHKWTIVQDCFN